jgi:hypothetical protein
LKFSVFFMLSVLEVSCFGRVDAKTITTEDTEDAQRILERNGKERSGGDGSSRREPGRAALRIACPDPPSWQTSGYLGRPGERPGGR